jgi:hypothetical protein
VESDDAARTAAGYENETVKSDRVIW